MLYSLRPKFSALVILTALAPTQLFFTVWCGLFFGIPLAMYLRQPPIGADGFPLFPAIFWCAAAAFILVPFVGSIRKKRSYAKTEYHVFRDHVEYEEGFFTIRKKTIRFEDVLEIDLRQNPLQRRAGIGSIQLITQQNIYDPFALRIQGYGQRNTPRLNGLLLRDIPDPDTEYERLRDLVAKAKQPAPSPVARRPSGSVPSSAQS